MTPSRIQARGKYFYCDGQKWLVRGLSYGPFAPNSAGEFLPELEQVRRDFQHLQDLGANLIRVYHIPAPWFLDELLNYGLKVFVDVPWDKHRCFFEDWNAQVEAKNRVRETARAIGRGGVVKTFRCRTRRNVEPSFFPVMLCLFLLVHSVGCKNAKAPAEAPQPTTTQESAGFRPSALGMQPPLLTKYDQLDKHIGQLVAIRGIVSDSKIATIIGVDVKPGDLRGEDCYAVGILTKWTTTQEQLDELFEKHGPVATRDPGTTYKLYFDLSGKGAEARKWPGDSDSKTRK